MNSTLLDSTKFVTGDQPTDKVVNELLKLIKSLNTNFGQLQKELAALEDEFDDLIHPDYPVYDGGLAATASWVATIDGGDSSTASWVLIIDGGTA